MNTAAVGAAWSLLGSMRNGQDVLHLSQKHALCWGRIHHFSHCRRSWGSKRILRLSVSLLTAVPTASQ